jgi:hypothetical protein
LFASISEGSILTVCLLVSKGHLLMTNHLSVAEKKQVIFVGLWLCIRSPVQLAPAPRIENVTLNQSLPERPFPRIFSLFVSHCLHLPLPHYFPALLRGCLGTPGRRPQHAR